MASKPKTATKKAKPKLRTAKPETKSETKTEARKPARKAAATAATVAPPARPRAAAPTGRRPHSDEDDVLMATGGGGAGFGRCGGRLLSSRLEQQLCNRLGIAGVVHTHNPRHYEIRFENGSVAAYAPMVVLRGRGREGKGVVIEAVEDPNAAILRKIVAFRAQYGQEFYVILVAPDDVLDQVPLASFDESCSSTNVNTLIARLAE
ncbi:MAG: hypothetical protein IT455_13580 [Planctomycetes bacterium]|nr:hypothetical protein [Planctomycetota bacterium]